MSSDERALLGQLERLQAWIILPFIPPLLYLLSLALSLSLEEIQASLLPLLIPDVLVVGFILPSIYRRDLLQRTFGPNAAPGDDRLRRLLELPRRVDLIGALTYAFGGAIYCVGACLMFGKPMMMAVAGTVLVILASMLTQLTSFVVVERWMQPFILREFHRRAAIAPKRGAPWLWVRQSWYLPYAFGVVISFALLAVAVVIWFHGHRAFVALAAEAHTLTPEAVRAHEQALLVDVGYPVLGVFLYTLALAFMAGRLLANRQKQSASALEKTLQTLASGEAALPGWLGTDELGDLSLGMGQVHEKLSAFSRQLNLSAVSLSSSAAQLESTASRQASLLTRQTAAVEETHVTVQEIHQTSRLAADKAEEVMRLAAKADSARAAGSAALSGGLTGLAEIRSQVEIIASRVAEMESKARQIASIAETVGTLAKQSNMLALNARIEAVRAGENGRGFGTVAGEFRLLADESIRETHRVRAILEEVALSARAAVEASDTGRQRIEASLDQVRSTGDAIRSLSSVVDANNSMARQIAATVAQQSAGVSQVFLAVEDLSRAMRETMDGLSENQAAIATLRGISADVSASTIQDRTVAA